LLLVFFFFSLFFSIHFSFLKKKKNTSASISAQIHADRKIFQKLYDATNGPNWKEAVDFTKSLCGVSGVGCNSERRITRMYISLFLSFFLFFLSLLKH